MTLQPELDAFFAAFCLRVPPETVAVLQQATDELRASGIAERALKKGDLAPNFALPNVPGALISCGELLSIGPVVVSFYRGGWCPFCVLELRRFQKILSEIRDLGGTLIAISPETRHNSFDTVQKNDLQFEILSDHGCHVARAFGIAFELPKPVQALYANLGHPLPVLNGVDDWQLPIPATYVIDRGHTIALAHIAPEYQVRLEPTAVLAALRRIQTRDARAA